MISFLLLLIFIISLSSFTIESNNSVFLNNLKQDHSKIKDLVLNYKVQPSLNSLKSNQSWNELGPAPLTNPVGVDLFSQFPLSGRISAIAINQSNPSFTSVLLKEGFGKQLIMDKLGYL